MQQMNCLRCGLPLEVAFQEHALAIGCAKCDRAMVIPVHLDQADFRIFGMENPSGWRWQDDPGVYELAARHYNERLRDEYQGLEEASNGEQVKP